MAEVVFKVDISPELKDKFETALDKVVKQFVRRLKFSIADEILSKSKLTEKQAFELADDLKERVAKRHRLWFEMETAPAMLVVDANILFSFFRHDSIRRYLIEELLTSGCDLVSPDFVLKELLSDKQKVMKFAGIEDTEFSFLCSILREEIKVFSEQEYDKYLPEAQKISPHDSAKDDPYFALALSLNCPIWSDEKSFKQQSKVKVYSTAELIKEIKL